MKQLIDAFNRASLILESKFISAWTQAFQLRARQHLDFFLEAADNPASAGTPKQRLEITGIGASGTLTRLMELASRDKIQPTSIDGLKAKLISDNVGLEFERRLTQLFDSYGSDKGSYHGYSLLYSWLLGKRDLDVGFRILEVGLGTNRTRVPSNMGPGGRPGASLRVWRDLGYSVEVVGLDVDRDSLFQEERISTFFVDQLDPRTWASLPARVMQSGFDLVIDDGLHAPLANLNTVLATIPFLRTGGAIVIEDVPERALPVWALAKRLTEESLELTVFQFNHAHCVVMRKKE